MEINELKIKKYNYGWTLKVYDADEGEWKEEQFKSFTALTGRIEDYYHNNMIP